MVSVMHMHMVRDRMGEHGMNAQVAGGMALRCGVRACGAPQGAGEGRPWPDPGVLLSEEGAAVRGESWLGWKE